MTAQIRMGEPEQTPELANFILGDMGPQGDTLAYLDGEQISVFGGIPGEEVVARVLRYRPRRRRNRRKPGSGNNVPAEKKKSRRRGKRNFGSQS